MKSVINYILLSFLILMGCTEIKPELNVSFDFLIGQDLTLEFKGLRKNELYTIQANKIDQIGRNWRSIIHFQTNEQGQIDKSIKESSIDTSAGLGISDLLWSMTMPVPPGKDWAAPPPKDFAQIEFKLIQNEDTVSIAKTQQWIIPPTVEKEVLNRSLEAEIFKSKNSEGKQPGILLLGGSGGGLSWARRLGAVLANEGYVCMALAYFNQGGLPKQLAQLPLEYLDQAIDYLINRSDVDSSKTAILGYSKGAELGLLMASRRSEIKSVIAIAPGSAIFQGFKPPKYPVISSWSYRGKDLDFVPNNYDKKFFETYDGMYLWYRTLAQQEAMDKAAIPVEKIQGPILLLSGVEDQIWPATYMGEQIMARLHVNDFPFERKHLAFPNAGHGIAEPPGHPTVNLAKRLGGTGKGNHEARKMVWDAIKQFFSKHFAEEEG